MNQLSGEPLELGSLYLAHRIAVLDWSIHASQYQAWSMFSVRLGKFYVFVKYEDRASQTRKVYHMTHNKMATGTRK